MKAKRYSKVIILNEDNVWVATYGLIFNKNGLTLKEAIRLYKKDEDKEGTEFEYQKGVEHYAFGIDTADDSEYFR